MHSHRLQRSQNADRPASVESLGYLTLFLAALCLAGCQEKAAPNPLEAAQRATGQGNDHLFRSAGQRTAEDQNAVQEPEAVKPQEPAKAEKLPEGEVLADIAKDFVQKQNGHPDTAKTGRWSYLSSQTPDPWETSNALQDMQWSDVAGASHFRSREVKKDRALQIWSRNLEEDRAAVASVLGTTEGLVLKPDGKARLYPVARWITGAKSDVVIQGSFTWTAPSKDCSVEGVVYVNGIQLYRAELTAAAQSSTFSIKTRVVPGTTVDFVAGTTPQSFHKIGTRTTTLLSAQIVSTGDGALNQSDAKLIQDVADGWRRFPRRPLPKDADISESTWNLDTDFAWWKKTFNEDYRRVHSGDLDQKPLVPEFLDEFAKYFHQRPQRKSMREMRILANQIDPHGDAILLAYRARLLEETHDRQDAALAEAWFNEADALLSKQSYSPHVAARIRCMHATLVDEWTPGSEQWESLLGRAAEDLVKAASDPQLTNADRAKITQLIDQTFTNENDTSARTNVIGRLAAEPKVDPWVREEVQAGEEVRIAWQARGNGFVNEVTREGFMHFQIALMEARMHALRAWKLQPKLPHGPTIMIKVIMGGQPVHDESARFWLDEAVRADFNFLPAYQALSLELQPKWGGSLEEMLGLARECLGTKRFDSRVPSMYEDILFDIKDLLGSWDPALNAPGIYDDFQRYYEGMEKAQPAPGWKSRYAAVSWHAGKTELVRQLMAELGPGSNRNGFAFYGLSWGSVAHALQDAQQGPAGYLPDEAGATMGVVFAPVGNRLWGANKSGGIDVWNVETKKLEQTLTEHSVALVALQQIVATKEVLSASQDGTVILWNAETMKPAKTLKLERFIRTAAARKDGAQVVVACGRDTTDEFLIWDVATDKRESEKMEIEGLVNKIALTPESKRVFYSIIDSKDPSVLAGLFVWDRNKADKHPLQELFRASITAWSLSYADQPLLFVGGKDNPNARMSGVRAVDPYTEQPKAVPATVFSAPISWVSALPTSNRAVVTLTTGDVSIWNSETQALDGSHRNKLDPIRTVTATPDEQWLAAIEPGGRIQVWPAAKKQFGWKINGPLLGTNIGGEVRTIRCIQGGKKLFIGTNHGVSLWDWDSGCKTAECFFDNLRLDGNVAPLNDGESVAAVTKLGFGLFDYRHGKELLFKPSGLETYYSVASSTDGSLVAVGDYKGQIHLYDGKARKLITAFQQEHTFVGAVQFSPDGKWLMSADGDAGIYRWDMSNPQKLNLNTKRTASYDVPPGKPVGLDFSRNGSIGVYRGQKEMTLFECEHGHPFFNRRGIFAALSNDANLLFTAGRVGGAGSDWSATMWDIPTGAKVFEILDSPRVPISALAFSPDESIAITGDDAGFVRAWDVKTGSEIIEFPAATHSRPAASTDVIR